jgi:hypothetical protein
MWAFFCGCACKIKLRGNESTIDTAGFLGYDVCICGSQEKCSHGRFISFLYVHSKFCKACFSLIGAQSHVA